MDGLDGITKDTLRDVMANIPDTRDNAAVRGYIADLLSRQNVEITPYTYNAVYWTTGAANNLAAGATNIPVNVNIQADADFLVVNQTYDANTANAARTANSIVVPNVTVLLVNTASGYQMMDQAVAVPLIFGTGQYPYVLPAPLLLPAKATLQVLATNYDAAAGYNLRLAFNGYKIKRF